MMDVDPLHRRGGPVCPRRAGRALAPGTHATCVDASAVVVASPRCWARVACVRVREWPDQVITAHTLRRRGSEAASLSCGRQNRPPPGLGFDSAGRAAQALAKARTKGRRTTTRAGGEAQIGKAITHVARPHRAATAAAQASDEERAVVVPSERPIRIGEGFSRRVNKVW